MPVIIHGGGKRISKSLNEAGIKSDFINGLRVTDEKSISIVEDVLNNFNQEICWNWTRDPQEHFPSMFNEI